MNLKKPLIFALSGAVIFANSCSSPQKIQQTQPEQYEVSPVLEEQASTLKRKVAIARFSNETKYGKSIFYDKENDPLGKQAMDILTAKLASTGKFMLFERSDLDKIMEEMNLGGNNDSVVINADYLIIGSVSEFGRNVEGDVGVVSRTKTQTARATVNIRLVDVYSGQIIYSEEGTGEATSEAKQVMGVGGQAGYNETLNDRAISAAISKLVNDIIQNLLDKPWRSYILDMEDGNIIISGGESQGLTTNKVLAVIEKGKKVKNPQTNMYIELPGREVGRIRVLSMFGDNELNEVSICVAESGTIPTSDFGKYFIQEIEK
ncbi:MAG: CsgG/HfaB family protein [Bacteroidales bacterium]|nr:CsgG/HfaB family protein [Bacteroidales bacterium]